MTELKLIMGPMYSGKTIKLVTLLTVEIYQHKRILYVNSTSDTRNDSTFSTHAPHISLPEEISSKKVKHLSEIDVSNIDIIGIDEAQFFDDLFITVLKWLEMSKTIFVAGLSGDFEKKAFGQIHLLISQADDIIHIKAKCACGMPAPFSKRVSNEVEQTLTSAKYIPVCRKHS